LEKTQVPHRIDETLDESLYREDNPHLTSRFCEVELDPKFQHGIRASPRSIGPLAGREGVCSLSNSRATYLFTHQAQRVLGVRGGILGKTQVPHLLDKT